jgi:hypothetical protein
LHMRDWTFSNTADYVVAFLLAVSIVAIMFV